MSEFNGNNNLPNGRGGNPPRSDAPGASQRRSQTEKETVKNNDRPDTAKTPKKKKVRKEHPGLRRFGIVICSLFLIGMVSVSSVGLYVLKYVTDYVNGEVEINLDEYKANQSQTTIMYLLDEDGNETEVIRLHGAENRIWVSIDEMPQDLQNAFIALEDQRFKTHSGVDWKRTISVATLHHFEQGGSTITQQLIKNLTGENGRTFIRKFREIQNALNLEKHYSKETILETYLNTLYLDAGCYGVQTASEYYFGKNVSELNLTECACLASITNAPRYYDPIINPENNLERRNMCLDFMCTQGFITEEECKAAKECELILTTDENYVAPEKDPESNDGMIDINESNAGQAAEEPEEVQSYYVDYVIDKVIEDLRDAYGYSYSEAWRLVYYGGLKIQIAMDPDIQAELEDVYYNRKGFPSAKNSYGESVQSCMVIMDFTGRVMGIVGQAGEKESARCLNIATDSMRQPGSSIKPLSIYSLAIDSNVYTWSYPMIQNYGIMLNGKRWPNNFGGNPGSPSSYENIQQALAPSHNTVPAQLIQEFGLEKSYNWLKDTFKITSLYDADLAYSPLAVGGMSHGVYAIEMCAAYTIFGTGGIYYEPYCYYTVTNSSGSVVYLTHNDTGEQVMDQSSADVMNKLLQTVATASNGTARNYKVSGFEMFAKTGTTSDEKDRWFIGATPYYVCSTWMGYSQHSEELDFVTNYNGEIYQRVMNAIHKGLPEKQFTFGDGIVQKYYCTRTGMIASSSCSSAVGWYKTDSIPPTCTSHAGVVAENTTAASGGAAETTTAASQQPETQPTTQAPVVDPEPEGGNAAAGD